MTTVAAVTLVLVFARLAPVLESILSLVTSEGAGKRSEEAVVCLPAEVVTADATCYGAHQAAVAFLAVRVIWVALAVLVTLCAAGR